MSARRVATIGAVGFDAMTFPAALRSAGVTRLVDLRLRRGMRGTEYAWANLRRLESSLRTHDIGYVHARGLAPPRDLLDFQHVRDAQLKVSGRERVALDPVYLERYARERLSPPVGLLEAIDGTDLAALFCVERDPRGCHRSLVAGWLRAHAGFDVIDLVP